MSLQQRETNLFGLHIGRGGGYSLCFYKGTANKIFVSRNFSPAFPS